MSTDLHFTREHFLQWLHSVCAMPLGEKQTVQRRREVYTYRYVLHCASACDSKGELCELLQQEYHTALSNASFPQYVKGVFMKTLELARKVESFDIGGSHREEASGENL